MFFHHSCRDLIHVRIRWLEVFLQENFDVFVRNRTICGIPLMDKSLHFHWLVLYIVKECKRFQECQWNIIQGGLLGVRLEIRGRCEKHSIWCESFGNAHNMNDLSTCCQPSQCITNKLGRLVKR